MGLKAAVNYRKLAIPQAYFRVEHITGGKRQGWSATVGIYADENAANPPLSTRLETVSTSSGLQQIEVPCQQPPVMLESFQVGTPYVADANPFSLLYAVAKEEIVKRYQATGVEDC